MTQYHRLKRKRLSDLLVDEGLVTKEVVLAALKEHQQTGEMVSSILQDSQEIDGYDLARVIVEQYQVPFLELSASTPNKDLIAEFPAELLNTSRLVPVDRFGDHVSFACQEIPTLEIHDKLKEFVSGSVLIFAALSRDIEERLKEFAPFERAKTAPPLAEGEQVLDLEAVATDEEWGSMFDSANESVLSEMDPNEAE